MKGYRKYFGKKLLWFVITLVVAVILNFVLPRLMPADPVSAITGKKVRADVAMTGEITLRGRVLPIGGLKEKVLAAKNAGIKKVLVPVANTKDIEELDAEITQGLRIVFVEHMDQVLKEALV